MTLRGRESLVALVLAALPMGPWASASGPPASDDRSAASELVVQGWQAYRVGDYRRAFAAFSGAYPLWPTAQAYLMAADSHWRRVLHALPPAAAAVPAGDPACPLSQARLVEDLGASLARQIGPGLHVQAASPFESGLQDGQRKRADCLRRLVDKARQRPADECADPAELGACLGPPVAR